MRTIILIWLLALIYCFLIPKPAHSGINATRISDSITFLDLAYQYPLTKEERAAKARLEIVKKQIERQFEEAKKASQAGLSKERLKEIEEQAIKVLTGATVVCKSEVF